MIGVSIPPLNLHLNECNGPNCPTETQISQQCQSSRWNTQRSEIDDTVITQRQQQLRQKFNKLTLSYTELMSLYLNLQEEHQRLKKYHSQLLSESHDSLLKLQQRIDTMDYPLILPGIDLEIHETPIKFLEDAAVQTETSAQSTSGEHGTPAESFEVNMKSQSPSKIILETVQQNQEFQNQTENAFTNEVECNKVFKMPLRKAGSFKQRFMLDLSIKTQKSFSNEIQTPLKRHRSIKIYEETVSDEPKSALLKPKRSNEEEESKKQFKQAMSKMKRDVQTSRRGDSRLTKLQRDMKFISNDCPPYQHPYFLAVLGIGLLFFFLFVQ